MSYDGLGLGYDSWRTYPDDYESDDRCYECSEKKKKWRDACEFFEGLMDMIYGKTKYSSGELEDILDQLCGYFHLRLPNGELKIYSKPKMEKIVANWVEFNQKYLKDIA